MHTGATNGTVFLRIKSLWRQTMDLTLTPVTCDMHAYSSKQSPNSISHDFAWCTSQSAMRVCRSIAFGSIESENNLHHSYHKLNEYSSAHSELIDLPSTSGR